MEKIRILVICRNEIILKTIERLINANNTWEATGCQSDEDAIHAAEGGGFTLILLGSGIEEDSELYLRRELGRSLPDARIVQHYGGGSGLLASEIRQALSN